MIIQVTDAGVALMQSATEPIVLTSYKLGSAFNYIPTEDQADIQGTLVYSGNVGAPDVQTANIILYPIHVAASLGPFSFGEIGLFYGSELFAICVLDSLLDKIPLDPNNNTGGAIVIDFFVPMTGSNYEMWANISQQNTNRASVAQGPEALPYSVQAIPNLYVVESDGTGKPFLAYTDRIGLWNFDSFGQVASAHVVSATNTAITVAASDLAGIEFGGLGQLMLQMSSGGAFASTRYISAMITSGSNIVLSLSAPMATVPKPDDTLNLYEPTIVSTASGTIGPGSFSSLTVTGTTQLGATQATSINNTPIGNSVPSTGRFTTLQSTGTATFASISVPAIDNTPIGSVTPSTGAFTTLTVTNQINGAGFTNLFSSPSPIGSVTPNTGKFTTLIAGQTQLGATTATGLDNTPIGAATPASGKFITLTSIGAASLASLAVIGATTLQTTTATNFTATGAVQLNAVTASSLDNTPIGNNVRNSGKFTTLSASGAASFQSISATALDGTPIGAVTPSTGVFTTLTSTGATSLGAVTAASIDGAPIGNTTAASGKFTTVAGTSATFSAGLSLTGTTGTLSVNGSVGTTGQVLTSQGPGAVPIWTTPTTGGSAGSFTTLVSTGSTTLGPTSAVSLDSTPIGAGTASTGRFTTLNATSGLTVSGGVSVTSGAISFNGAAGTSGQVLTSQGPATSPIWTTPLANGASPSFAALTVVGASSLAAVSATTITASGAASAASLTLTSSTAPLTINGSNGTVGQFLTSQGDSLPPQWSTLSLSNANITSGSIDGATIGLVTPSSASFTSLRVSGTSPILLNGAAGTTGQVLTSQGTGAAPKWADPTGGSSSTVANFTSGTIDGVVIGSSNPSLASFTNLFALNSNLGNASMTSLAVTGGTPIYVNGQSGLAGQSLVSAGGSSNPIWTNAVNIIAGQIEQTIIGAVTPAAATFSNLTLSGASSVFTVSGNAGTAGQVLTSGGPSSTPTWASPTSGGVVTITGGTINGVTIGATTPGAVSSTSLSVTGATSPVSLNGSAGTAGQVLTSAGPGATPTWTTAASSTVASFTSGTLNGVTIGGTTPAPATVTSLTLSGATSPVTLNGTPGTAGQVLVSKGAGATPAWSALSGGTF